MNGSTSSYVYWMIDCKTPNCRTQNAVSFIGLHDGRLIYALPDCLPPGFDFGCMECGEIHHYTPEDLRARLLPTPPPPGWIPSF